MSLSLSVRAVPVDPPQLPDDAFIPEAYLFEALNLGDGWDTATLSELRANPRTIDKGSHAHSFLQGVLAGLAHDPDDRSNDDDFNGLQAALRFLEAHGGIEVYAS